MDQRQGCCQGFPGVRRPTLTDVCARRSAVAARGSGLGSWTCSKASLIAESLREGTSLDDLRLVIRKLSRWAISDAAENQPKVWTIIEFAADDTRPGQAGRAVRRRAGRARLVHRLPHTRDPSTWSFPARSSVTRAAMPTDTPRPSPTPGAWASLKPSSTGASEARRPRRMPEVNRCREAAQHQATVALPPRQIRRERQSPTWLGDTGTA